MADAALHRRGPDGASVRYLRYAALRREPDLLRHAVAVEIRCHEQALWSARRC